MPLFWVTQRRIRLVNLVVGPLNIALGVMFHFNTFIPYSGDIWLALGLASGLGSLYLGVHNRRSKVIAIVGALYIVFYLSRLCGVILAWVYADNDPTPWWQYGTGVIAWAMLTVWSGGFYAMSMAYMEGKVKK